MNETTKLTKCKPDYIGKEKIAVYLKSRNMHRLKKFASRQRLSLSGAILLLVNEGMNSRKEKGEDIP